MKSLVSLLAAAAVILLFGNELCAQALYKYIDEDGVQNFTNIAPVRPVYDLEISGSPEPTAPPSVSYPKSQSFDPIIEKYATEHQLDPSLIRSIIAQESGFNPKAVSRKGARGLMQLMPATAASLGVRNSFDPEQNIQGGVKHFRFLLDSFNNNLELSLAAYNAGQNLVQRLGKVPAIKETRDYVRSITQRYGKKDAGIRAQETSNYFSRSIDASGTLVLTNIPPVASSQ